MFHLKPPVVVCKVHVSVGKALEGSSKRGRSSSLLGLSVHPDLGALPHVGRSRHCLRELELTGKS